MKTTIEIPDDLHKQACIRAAKEGTTLQELIVTSLQRILQYPSFTVPVLTGAHFVIDHDGWPVLQRSSSTKVTNAMIDQLREEERV